jgi:sec-independent protein translocase protein TatA
MPNIGPLELIVVLIIALVVLGPKKLPEFGRSVGKGLREFKGALTGGGSHRDDDDDHVALEDEKPKKAPVKQA